MNDNELITGTITVPRAIWTDVLEYAAGRAAEYRRSGGTAVAAIEPNEAQNYGVPHTVRELVDATNTRGRTVYRMLAASAGSPVPIDDISKALGFEGLQTPGLLGSMGRSMWARGFRNARRD